jgi:site-specific recombinase XerD
MIPENYAVDLKTPKVTLRPTMPFTREQMKRILGAVDDFEKEMPSRAKENARRMRALILLLRFSGLRISDAVNLSEEQIAGSRLFLYTQKTACPCTGPARCGTGCARTDAHDEQPILVLVWCR